MVVPIIPMPITINIPPVDLKNIIDKTVEFVNKGGSAFEATIVQKGKDNPTFGFIKPGHPFHNYYRWKLSELKAASAPPVAPPTPADKAPEPAEAPTKPIVAAPTVVSKVAAAPPKLIKPSHSEPPPPLEFYLNLPNISAQELDIMRLTAQFVARNGQAFHHGLLNRENRNPQFDFLKHNHPLNIIFSAYVNCYSRVLLPSRDTIEKLKSPQYREKAAILERAVSHMEWEQGQERARKQAEEEEDNERLAMALIDWHDFVIVETIEPFDGETDLPPPATEDQLLAGVMPAAPEVVDIAPVEAEMETDEMEMEADMEEEEQPAGPAPSATPRPAEIAEAPSSPIIPEEPATVPLPPPDTKLKILKEPIKRPDTKKSAMMMVCPRCNQLVREDDYNEHMRIELLDPKFAQMSKEMEKRKKEAYAPSNSDSFGNLSKLAKHRSDIFGGAETDIGKVVGEEGKTGPEKVIWDGHSGSIPRTTSAALAGASLQEPILSASGGSEKPSIGPHSVSTPSVSAVPTRQPIITVVGGASSVPRPVIAPVVSAPLMGMPPGMMPPMMPYGVPHMVPGMMPIPGMFAYGAPPPGMHIPPPPEEEPNSKRQKIEELNLIPEEKFLADYPSAIDLLVQVPPAPSDKNEWNFQGQQIPMTFQPTATIQAVKDRIKEELGMPPNKQKLKTPHISILKDNLSLAYYNITPGTLLVLGAKERGGRKK